MNNFSNENITLLSNEYRNYLSATNDDHLKVVRSGQMLYRQNLVQLQQVSEPFFYATVSDVSLAKVKLHLTSVEASICSCPATTICRHQLATFFQLYSTISNVTEWVDDWRASGVSPSTFDKIKHLQTASTLLAQKNVLPQEPIAWKEMIQHTFHSYFDDSVSDKELQEVWKLYKYQLSIPTPVEREWKQLFDLYIHFYTYHLLHDYLQNRNISSSKWTQLLEICLDKLDDVLYKMSVQSTFFAFDEFYSQLRKDAIFLFQSTIFEKENIRGCRLLWTKLFRKRDDWQQLLSYLKTIPSTLVTDVTKCLLFLQLKDDEFFHLLEQLPVKATVYLLDWIDLAIAQKEDARLKQFASILFDKVKEYLKLSSISINKEAFCNLILKKAKQMEANCKSYTFYEEALLATLPYSSILYTEYLFEEGHYEKWCAYLIYTNQSMSTLSKEKMKLLEKYYTVGCFSLYHREIQKLIEQKNRASYSEATIYLKQLRQLYKRHDKKSQWDYFVSQLLERTKRQRALIEEIKRSKCLDG